MKCPVCGTPDLLMTERQGVEIDYCPSCRGVWLDRGELDKLIERADGGGTMPAHPARGGAGDERLPREYRDPHDHREYGDGAHRRSPQYGHDGRRRHYEQPRRKKSLFEMFDFD
ncbi:zf-TFIIB domain-containing protein [Pandoraea sp. CB10b_02]|uniref:TFIIB-type zinc ribbon-containing protein n=1 Tax=Pandoraea sp. CB10b_02 TaxID=2014535 RepID=UPI00257E2FE1|nr:zf-TFIIB domain-containing protein [Pandoraea sp. CB10b_02]